MSSLAPRYLGTRTWHLIGATFGLGLILASLGQCPDVPVARSHLPANTTLIAVVNQHPITQRDLEQLSNRAVAELDADSKQRALAYLIDRELMIQRAEEVGLVESDPTIRRALASALIATVEIPNIEGEQDPGQRRQAAENARRQLNARRRAFIDELRLSADIEFPNDQASGPVP